MRRRQLIVLFTGTLATFPFGSRAQERNRVSKIGVIMNYAETDAEGQTRLSALREELGRLGWKDGNNAQLETRWTGGRSDLMLAYAAQLVSQPADVIVANSTPLLTILKQLTGTVPVVFVQVADPISSGFVNNYAKPGGNITGFTDFDTSIAGKWVEILKEAAPSVTRMTVLLNPQQANHDAFFEVIKSAAATFKVQISKAAVHDRAEIEQAIAAVAGEAGRGLIVLPGPLNNTQRGAIIEMTGRFHLPTVYPFKYYATDGGLLFYGDNQLDQWGKAAGYVDRILRGEKPSDLPVQAPTKFELIVNLKTARALGLTIPQTLLATADEVIE